MGKSVDENTWHGLRGKESKGARKGFYNADYLGLVAHVRPRLRMPPVFSFADEARPVFFLDESAEQTDSDIKRDSGSPTLRSDVHVQLGVLAINSIFCAV